ncbi:nucleotide-sugar transporter family protein [Cryptosporidium serpentis]
MNNQVLNILCIFGIYFFFILYGVVQEKIHNLGNKKINDHFHYNLFLVSCFCLVNSIVSLFILWINKKGDKNINKNLKKINENKLNNKNHDNSILSIEIGCLYEILLTSITYVAAMVLTNIALGKVNYPTQVLVKSAKCVPIIVIGLLYFKTKYPWYDYFTVITITISLSCFNMMQIQNKQAGTNQTLSGIGLLSLSLLCDGLTGPRQDKLISKYNISSNKLMFYTNLFATIICGILSLTIEGLEPYRFILRYKDSFYFILLLSLTGTCGQFFIFQSLIRFGSLYLAIITTTRKFFTVLLSVLLFNHNLLFGQWICVISIFIVLGIQSIYSRLNKKINKE